MVRSNRTCTILLRGALVLGAILACFGDAPAQPAAGNTTLEATVAATLGHGQPRIENGKCASLDPRDVSSPAVELSGVEGSERASGTYTVRGIIAGQCLTEAGYFEDGRKIRDIAVANEPVFRRFDFELPVNASRRGEIRVYNSAGGREAVDVSEQRAALRPAVPPVR